MLGFAILVAAIVATGVVVARLLYRRFESESADPFEIFVAGVLLGGALWIAANWILALPLLLTKRNLLIVAVLFVIVGCLLLRGRFVRARWTAWVIIGAFAVTLWTGFVLWRGSVMPPVSHDVLSYHLPKAVMIMRAEGHERFDWPDARLRNFPSNYELLLADVLILSGTDRLTEWIGTACYLAFLALVALYVRRWWGTGLHVVASVLAAAGAPLLLLHSGHDKNDLLAAVFASGAIYWSARWCARGGVVPAMLAIVFGAVAVGTKVTAGAILIGIAPFGILALWRRRPNIRAILGAFGFAAIAAALCGGWVFVQNFGRESPELTGGVPTAAYGDWQNLIDIPYLLIRASLGLPARLPWSDEAWPWYRYNLYGSQYGEILGIALIALPFCIWLYRRQGQDDARAERAIATGAAIIAFVALLPLVQVPRSNGQAAVRYTFFILPIVIGWTIAPFMRSLRASRYSWTAHVTTASLLVFSGVLAMETASFDSFATPADALWCAKNPGTRRSPRMPNRAELVVDGLAGPRDTIALYGGVSDVWVHPAYGAALSRTVVFVREVAEIPPDAKWVAIDYMPALAGRPAGEELRLFEQLRRDSRFALVFRNERFNQAVFRRL